MLPEGFVRQAKTRAPRVDVTYTTPDGKTLRSKPDAVRYLKGKPAYDGVSPEDFDFSSTAKRKRCDEDADTERAKLQEALNAEIAERAKHQEALIAEWTKHQEALIAEWTKLEEILNAERTKLQEALNAEQTKHEDSKKELASARAHSAQQDKERASQKIRYEAEIFLLERDRAVA